MYNNPFMYQNLYKPSLFSKLLGGGSAIKGAATGINWENILSNTQKSLGIINQAIPIVHQVKPIITNAKTMFKIANAMKENKAPTKTNIENKTTTPISNNNTNNKPIFYI